MLHKIHQIEIKYKGNLFDQVGVEGILQSLIETVSFVPARQCVSVCVYVRMSPSSFAKACGVALLDAGSGAALLCAALCLAVCCRCCCWLAGVFCVSVFCLPAAAAAVATACRMPPAAAVSWHVVLALSLGFGLSLARWLQPAVAVATLATLRRQAGSNGSGWRRFALCSAEFSISVVS